MLSMKRQPPIPVPAGRQSVMTARVARLVVELGGSARHIHLYGNQRRRAAVCGVSRRELSPAPLRRCRVWCWISGGGAGGGSGCGDERVSWPLAASSFLHNAGVWEMNIYLKHKDGNVLKPTESAMFMRVSIQRAAKIEAQLGRTSFGRGC